jgi:choline-sulfatase
VSKPNIVLIVSDQHRGDWLGASGNRLVTTPNLDRLAAEGVNFTQAYCASPLCVPSRMSLMSGREPHRTDVYGNEDYLASDVPTFAHAAAIAGYDTVLCGRMHFVGPDQRHGFQERLVGDITPSYPGGPKTDYAHLRGTTDPDRISIELAGPGKSPVLDYDAAVVLACEEYVQKRVECEAATPLLMTVGLYGPHAPYTSPSEEFEAALAAVRAHDQVIPADAEPHPAIQQQREAQRLDTVTPEQLTMVRANYVGLINHLDRNVGRILNAIANLPGDTIILYTSDHGEMAGDHGLFWKRSFYEQSVRVPMIWRAFGPGADKFTVASQRVDTPVSLLDVAPTVAAFAGAPALPNGDGRSLRSLMRQPQAAGQAEEERPVFSELVTGARGAVRMVRSGRFKLVYHHAASHHQLFDLADDAAETNDLFGDPRFDKDVERLMRLARDGWDADEILAERSLCEADKTFMRDWGARVGIGPLDLWKQEGPFFS